MCEPNSKRGAKNFTINIQIIADETLVRLVVVIEEAGFECKVGYSLEECPDVDQWWREKEVDVRSWLDTYGLSRIAELMSCCVARMLVPLRVIVGRVDRGLIPRGAVAPAVQTEWSYRYTYESERTTMTAVLNDDKVVSVMEAKVKAAEKNVIIFIQMRMNDVIAIHRAEFSYKKDVKMRHVIPWMDAQKSLVSQSAASAGLPVGPFMVGFDKVISLVWAGITKGLAQSHDKKVLKKDLDDQKLFADEE